jgi:hypothetical protein
MILRETFPATMVLILTTPKDFQNWVQIKCPKD